jgi:hypothetical protein
VGTYYVKVDEYGNDHEIPTYNIAFTVLQSCGATLLAPTGLHPAAASDAHIDLAWTDNSDESDFHIERSPNGSTGWTEVGTVGLDVTNYSDSGLNPATTYYYRVRAHRHSDNQYSGYSNVASCTTLGIVEPTPTVNNPPYAPSDPSPADGATDQNLNVDLSWSGGDPDGDAVTYDVFLAANGISSAAPVCNDVTDTGCDPGALSYDTRYSWWVVARDEDGATRTGPVWHFTTLANGMIETGSYHHPRDRLVLLGALFPWVPVSADVATLRHYGIAYLPLGWASTLAGNPSEIESHAEDYHAYVSGGTWFTRGSTQSDRATRWVHVPKSSTISREVLQLPQS